MTLKLGMQHRVFEYYRSFKWWPWIDLDLFYGTIPYAFVWVKGKPMDFSDTIVVYDIKDYR